MVATSPSNMRGCCEVRPRSAPEKKVFRCEDFLDGPYEYHPVEHGGIRGSCQHYQTRSLIAHDEIKKYSYEDIIREHIENLVMVASQEERWHALASHLPISYLDFLTPVHYCILELVGKSRDNIKEEVPLSDTEPPQKKKKLNRTTQIKFVSLPNESDASSASDNENESIQLKCQYKVKVNLLRQAYERFIDAGLKGLTQIELGQILGVEFYTSRAICQTLKNQKIVREFLEDKGRQRFSRFIAIAATGSVEKKYAAEKKKFLEYLDTTNDLTNISKTDSDLNVNIKNEANIKNIEDEKTSNDQNKDITELEPSSKYTKSCNESPFSVKKGPTLKQLQFANGMIKALREKLTIVGYHTLNKIVSKDIGQPPMDNKSLKRFVQNLAAHGQLRIYKLNWPGCEGQYSIMICAPHITKTHPTVTATYKEINALKALRRNDDDENKTGDQQYAVADDDCILSFKAYPRYKKAQKLHEFVFKLVYENDDTKMYDSYYPYGCISLARMIPEMPAALALGHLSPNNITDIKIAKKHEPLLSLKLSEVPSYIRKAIVNSKCLITHLKNNFRILASFGLVQLCEQCCNSSILDYNNRPSNKYVIFVNRHATIINTTGTWPQEGIDPKSLHIKFYLQNSSDVKKYWATLYDISTNTTIVRKKRQYELPHIPTRFLDELTLHDNGNIFGDGLGAAGFDSIYWIDKPRQWQEFNIFKYKKILKPAKKLPENKVFKTVIKKKSKVKPKKAAIKQKPLKVPRIVKNQKTRNKIRNTIKWTKWEDDIITMVMAARMIMSPSTQPGCLQVSNYVAKDIISIRYSGKTGTHCHKRALVLEKSTSANRDRIINELRRKRHLVAKYEGLLKKIRLKYSANLAKYLNEARLRMMELVWIIAQVIKSKSFGHKVACVSKNIDDFHEKFRITPFMEKKNANLYLKQNDSKDPIRVSTIVEAILQTVNSINNEEFDILVSDIVYSIFNNYPEEILRIALEQVKKKWSYSCT
ncbi:General transcription factor 3C polypeptide 1 [Eumeta japonica]|uniref:General transcription factor 3C polypeptide 1 n=1 Tax=Eumeta variegata TaxID=151549 RepID=A0A4C1TKD4_EUMVA|nr:General transcription factor 3C polypeptide 1 [Eumeta japonica]